MPACTAREDADRVRVGHALMLLDEILFEAQRLFLGRLAGMLDDAGHVSALREEPRPELFRDHRYTDSLPGRLKRTKASEVAGHRQGRDVKNLSLIHRDAVDVIQDVGRSLLGEGVDP